MVREVRLSRECPGQAGGHESVLDDEHRLVDDWESDENDDLSTPSPLSPKPSAPRNLAGAVTGKAVAVKSRRSTSRRVTANTSATSAIRRQITVSLAYRDWRLLHDEAVRRHLSLAELARQWLRPHLDQLEDTGENSVCCVNVTNHGGSH